MDTIEIRYNKKTMIPMIAVLIAVLLGILYYVYLSGKKDDNIAIKVLYIFLSGSLIYAIYHPVRKLLRNEPVLVFSKSGLDINSGNKTASFAWSQIIEWSIERDKDGNTYYLKVKNSEMTKNINISWLEKKPAEIEELMHKYK